MKLADVVTLREPLTWDEARIAEVEESGASIGRAVELQKHFDSADALMELATREEQATIKTLQNRLSDDFNQIRTNILLSEHSLPPMLCTDSPGDTISKAAKAPRIELAEARAIADKLGFIVVPFAYLDARSYQEESKDTIRAIKAFDKNLTDLGYSIYVLAPVHHYSLDKHVRAEGDQEIYAGKPCEQAFLAIEMAVPVFRTIFSNLQQLRDYAEDTAEEVGNNRGRIDENRAAINKNSQEIRNLRRRIDTLQKQVEREREEALLRESREKEMRRQLEELRSQSRFWAYEPMMLAIPNGTNIKEADTPAIVGPCWGPDFEDIVIAALDMKEIKGQGEMLDAAALQWVEMGHRVKKAGAYIPSPEVQRINVVALPPVDLGGITPPFQG